MWILFLLRSIILGGKSGIFIWWIVIPSSLPYGLLLALIGADIGISLILNPIYDWYIVRQRHQFQFEYASDLESDTSSDEEEMEEPIEIPIVSSPQIKSRLVRNCIWSLIENLIIWPLLLIISKWIHSNLLFFWTGIGTMTILGFVIGISFVFSLLVEYERVRHALTIALLVPLFIGAFAGWFWLLLIGGALNVAGGIVLIIYCSYPTLTYTQIWNYLRAEFGDFNLNLYEEESIEEEN